MLKASRATFLAILLAAVAGMVPIAADVPAGARVPTTHVVESRDGIAIRSQIVGGRTRVERVTPEPKRLLVLDRPLEIRAVEPGGRRAVLADPLPSGATAFAPVGRASTTLVIADLVHGTADEYVVGLNVEPEAFGVGSPLLYVIDHRPKRDPVSYRVAALNVNTGAVEPVFGPYQQKVALDDMAADARQQVAAPSGRQLYTLYVETARTGDARSEYGGYETASASSAEEWTTAFVHVLDISENWAYCVNLPVEFGRGDPSGNAIAVSPDGTRLFVADARSGALAVLDATSLTRLALVAHPPAFMTAPLPTEVRARDGLTLAATGTGVMLTAHGERWTFDVATTSWRSRQP